MRDPPSVARILVSDPHPDVTALLAFVVRRQGHEPVAADGSCEQLREVEALLVEPADAGGRELALWARAHLPALPVVCVSILPPGPETAPLRPDVYLVKPFPLRELERALATALDGAPAGRPLRRA